jgi:hypothetical protein
MAPTKVKFIPSKKTVGQCAEKVPKDLQDEVSANFQSQVARYFHVAREKLVEDAV